MLHCIKISNTKYSVLAEDIFFAEKTFVFHACLILLSKSHNRKNSILSC